MVFWKENSGRQLQLITHENEGRDETNYSSPSTFTFFDDPEVPFGPQGPPPPEPPGRPGPPGPPGLPPGWPPAPSSAGDGERVSSGNTSRERWHPRSPPPEPHLTPIPMCERDN